MPRRDNLKLIVLAAAIVGTSMVYIEGVADNVALPAIQAEFNARLTDLQWIDQVYALCLAALLLVGGSLGDRFGRKRMFVIGIIAFVIASSLGGLTQNTAQLIGARALQGLSAAILVPGSLAIITDHFDEKERGPAIGTWWAFATIMLAVGLVMGGWLVQNISWRAIFFINIPLGIAALALLTLIPSTPRAGALAQTDWPGAILATFGLGGVVYALIEQTNVGLTHPIVLFAFLGGIALLVAFVFVEARAQNPIMPLTLFRSQNFTTANLLLLLINGILTSLLFFLPLNLIQVQGYPAGQASLAILPIILGVFVFSRLAGSLATRVGSRLVLVLGPLASALGFVLLSQQGIGGNYWLTFFPALLIIGLGFAFSLTPLTTVGMAAVSTDRAGVGSGVLNAAARVGNLIVVTLLTAVIAIVFGQSLVNNIAHLQLAPPVANAVLEQRPRLGGAQAPAELDAPTRAQINLAIDESFVEGFRIVMLACAGILVVTSVGAFLLVDRETGETSRAQTNSASSSEPML